MNKQKILYLLIGAVIIIILLFGFVMFKLITDNNQCITNPFIYGAVAIEKQGMTVMCRCDSLDPEYIGFSYDKDGIYIQDEYDYTPFSNVALNISNSFSNIKVSK